MEARRMDFVERQVRGVAAHRRSRAFQPGGQPTKRRPMYVRVLGHGAPVLLLPGAGVPAQALLPLAHKLSLDHQILLPDMPGYGRSKEPPRDMSTARKMLLEVLNVLRIERLSVIGYGLGCYRMLELALGHEVYLDRLIALAPMANPSTAAAALDPLIELLATTRRDPGDVARTRWTCVDSLAQDDELRAELGSWLEQLDRETLQAERRVLRHAPELHAQLASLEIPLYIRVGDRDGCAPLEEASRLGACLPNSTVDVVPNLGHLLVQQDLAGTVDAVRAALR